MPRIAMAICVVVLVTASIGANIILYPAVFKAVGTTHASPVSDGTPDVPETKETEGPVAVKNLPALPDDLAKWNPKRMRKIESAVTEAVPYVAAHSEYADQYEDYARPQATEPDAVTYSDAGNEAGEATPSESEPMPEATPNYQHCEVEPFYSGDRGQAIGDRGEEAEGDGDATEEAASEDAGAVETSCASDDISNRPICGDTTETQGSMAWQPPVEYHATPYESADSQRPRPGAWPATVVDSFQYHQASSGQTSGSDTASYREQHTQNDVTAVMPESSVPSVRKPLQQIDSAMIIEETSDWEASTPMVAFHDTRSSDETQPQTACEKTEALDAERLQPELKRLPEVTGADILPDASPSSEPVDYPVTR